MPVLTFLYPDNFGENDPHICLFSFFFPSFVFAAFVCSSGTPPTMLNTSNPASATTTGYGSGSPQGASSSVSASAAHLQPFIGNIILVTSFITAKITLEI